MTDSTLLVDLTMALTVALVGVLVSLRLRQSAILGYIGGGILIGPYTPGLVGNPDSVQALADIGVILLMFTIGVQLSVRDLLQSGRIAIAGGLLQVVVIIAIGYLVGRALGWGSLESFVFGAVVSNSSSTVLGKVLGERGEADSTHGRISLAWSTVQDLSTVVLVVIIGALAEGGNQLLGDLLLAVGRVGLFLVLLLPVGWKVLPRLFGRIAALQSREIFVIAVAVFALGMAALASQFGLSLALGAFIAGVVVSESDLWHQILGEIIPLRDIFAGLFFVSVGMLVDPGFVARNIPLLLVALLMIVVVKGTIVAVITTLFRYPIETAVLTGVTLAQSAEFSFLLARVGADLGAITSATFSLLLASAAMSIVLAPLLQGVARPIARWVGAHLPEPALARDPCLDANPSSPRGHAVICGYGRVGRVIGEALLRRGFSFVVIEQNQRIVEQLRARGIPALFGTADNPILLDRAHLDQARILMVAIPDPLATRRIVDYARRVNPRLEIVVRTHRLEDLPFLESVGVTEAVLGELELALEMARVAMRRFGVSTLETQALLQGLRQHHLATPEAPTSTRRRADRSGAS